MDCTNPDTGVALEVQDVKVTVNGEDSNRFAIQHEFCEIIGEDSSWAAYVHIMTALGLLMGGIGFWMSFRQNREHVDDDDDWDDDDEDLDDDFEDALDDLEEF